MLNFTVGPVQMDKEIIDVALEQIPYFRTSEFSSIMFENEVLIKKVSETTAESKVVFLTGSGSLAMEAAVINCFSRDDKLLVVNGGSFGQRFVDICSAYKIPFDEISLGYGEVLTKERLYQYHGDDYTGFLINVHETSTGVLYDMDLISNYCKEHNLLLVSDAISSFLADRISMDRLQIDVLILASQKALAIAPGLSILVLSERAQKLIMNSKIQSIYMNLRSALEEMKRGQTPFTPAVGTLLQLNKRLRQIEEKGLDAEIDKVFKLAMNFRNRIKKLPFSMFSSSPSNASTALLCKNVSAYKIFTMLKDRYGVWVCPNGGELKDKIFRVGHMGALNFDDNTVLINALEDLCRHGFK